MSVKKLDHYIAPLLQTHFSISRNCKSLCKEQGSNLHRLAAGNHLPNYFADFYFLETSMLWKLAGSCQALRLALDRRCTQNSMDSPRKRTQTNENRKEKGWKGVSRAFVFAWLDNISNIPASMQD
ncbi:hypothetical protein SCA6_018986 [Theobroma cacao]